MLAQISRDSALVPVQKCSSNGMVKASACQGFFGDHFEYVSIPAAGGRSNASHLTGGLMGFRLQ